ncbi:MAG: hypothetical protein A2798_02335 [Candidatus Levybacteria bacterium RIFCSPHIGHO2_01_FULL_37_17]|nr:MAG: hypothetical protein A2798_02335 [Candidatus Levybacteria bacterium RIFCSPHIGHO2_01_FULL_37_17]OGH36714.1 MAG: hypothetical protein A2959_00325 [Candidatus Levybacteria bacterium RIFCSPLOWO2_01_FULL_38_23]
MSKFDKNFFLLADYASTDRDGKLMINGVFETIYAQSVPALHQTLYLVGSVMVDDKDIQSANVDLDILDSKGNSIVENKIPTLKVSLPKYNDRKRNFNIIYQLNSVKLSNYGEHKIAVKVNGKDLASASFFVDKPSN